MCSLNLAPRASGSRSTFRDRSGRDIDAVLDFERVAPTVSEAHPRTEHWAPLYVALDAAEATGHSSEVAVDGFWYALSKRSCRFA